MSLKWGACKLLYKHYFLTCDLLRIIDTVHLLFGPEKTIKRVYIISALQTLEATRLQEPMVSWVVGFLHICRTAFLHNSAFKQCMPMTLLQEPAVFWTTFGPTCGLPEGVLEEFIAVSWKVSGVNQTKLDTFSELYCTMLSGGEAGMECGQRGGRQTRKETGNLAEEMWEWGLQSSLIKPTWCVGLHW